MEQSWLKRARSYILLVLVAVVLALVLKACVIEAYRIPSGSMENTLLPGDFVLVNRLVYGGSLPRKIPFMNLKLPPPGIGAVRGPEHGDVVAYEQRGRAGGEGLTYVKRCIGLPGDTLMIQENVVFVNSREFPPPASAIVDAGRASRAGASSALIFPPGSGFSEDNYGPIRIPRRGDRIPLDRGNIRVWRSLIEGEGHTITLDADRVVIDGRSTNEYVTGEDYYFMLGDNRENSLDSRFRGFIPAGDIVGKVMFVYWSIDRATGDIRWARLNTLVH